MHWALKKSMVPRTGSNLRALTCSGEVEEMPNTLTHSLTSLLLSLSLVRLFLEKKNYNTLLFLTFIKADFCYFWGEKRCQALRRFSYALWRVIRFIIYIDFPGEGSQRVRDVKLLLAWATPTMHPELAGALEPPCCEESNSTGCV